MTQPLVQKPLGQFLDELASVEPVPGGGSVAALSGAMGAALVAMVCRLTIGKKGYEDANAEMQDVLTHAEMLRAQLLDLAEADTRAYAAVMEAYKLAKSTDAEKATRVTAIQHAIKQASQVPLQVAKACGAVIELTARVAARGNKNAASDAGVGALLAGAGLTGAAMNVTINLGSIQDQRFVAAYHAQVAELTARAEEAQPEILRTIQGRM